MSQMASSQTLQVAWYPVDQKGMGQHFDHRDKYAVVGALTVATPAVLLQVRGSVENRLLLEPGGMYILSGESRGDCQATAHKSCKCCWTHGIETVSGHEAGRVALVFRTWQDPRYR